MSDKMISSSRAVRVADFVQYVKEQKETWDKTFEMERNRCRMLNEADQKYYEVLEARSRAVLEKYLRDVGQRQTGAPAGQVLK